eukprot:3441068-Rhodomonas_salina.1
MLGFDSYESRNYLALPSALASPAPPVLFAFTKRKSAPTTDLCPGQPAVICAFGVSIPNMGSDPSEMKPMPVDLDDSETRFQPPQLTPAQRQEALNRIFSGSSLMSEEREPRGVHEQVVAKDELGNSSNVKKRISWIDDSSASSGPVSGMKTISDTSGDVPIYSRSQNSPEKTDKEKMARHIELAASSSSNFSLPELRGLARAARVAGEFRVDRDLSAKGQQQQIDELSPTSKKRFKRTQLTPGPTKSQDANGSSGSRTVITAATDSSTSGILDRIAARDSSSSTPGSLSRDQ